MKICKKAFLIFQVTMAVVTTVLMTIYWVLLCHFIKETISFIESVILSTCIAFIYAILLLPVWKLWKGKTWYSLSLLFFSTITIIAMLSFIISIIDTRDWGFSLFWITIYIYVLAFPANLIISIPIGLIGKYISTKYNNEDS